MSLFILKNEYRTARINRFRQVYTWLGFIESRNKIMLCFLGGGELVWLCGTVDPRISMILFLMYMCSCIWQGPKFKLSHHTQSIYDCFASLCTIMKLVKRKSEWLPLKDIINSCSALYFIGFFQNLVNILLILFILWIFLHQKRKQQKWQVGSMRRVSTDVYNSHRYTSEIEWGTHKWRNR